MLSVLRNLSSTRTRAKQQGRWISQSAVILNNLLDTLINYEQQGIPAKAGVSGSDSFDIGRMHRLLHELGDPQIRWRAIHIAGSKGKGSTVSMLSSILHACGYKVGTYTSPHLHHLGERIAIGGQPMQQGHIDQLISRHADLIQRRQQREQGKLSHFEVLTALAFRHFSDQSIDVGVIETGMGGTTDATNVFTVDNLVMSIITALGYEHVEALGGTIQSIAAAKAGIMKPGRPVVVARQQHAEALAVLLEQATQLRCPVVHADQQVTVRHHSFHLLDVPSSTIARERVSITCQQLHGDSYTNNSQHLAASTQQQSQQHEQQQDAKHSIHSGVSSVPPDVATQPSTLQLPSELEVALVGDHQHDNLATVLAACQQLVKQGWKIDQNGIIRGLQSARLPGRLQVLRLDQQPGANSGGGMQLNQLLLVLDGAHSPEAGSCLAASLKRMFPDAAIGLVVAMASDKEHRGVLAALRNLQPCAVVFTSVPVAGSHARAASPGVLAAQWQAAAMLDNNRQPGRQRCRELIKASLQSAIESAKREVHGAISSKGGHGVGVVVVTGSLHAVAAAQRLDEVAALLARAQHNDQ